MIRYIWVTLCSALILVPSLNAQSTASKAAGEASSSGGRQCWIMTTTTPEDVENPMKILSGDKLHEVKMYLRSMGTPVKVDATGIVRAVKVLIDENGQEFYQNLSYTQIPEGVQRALIILVPNKEDAPGLRFRSKLIDLSKFREGGCLYVNLVGTRLGISIGDQKVGIPSGEARFINVLDGEEKSVQSVQFFYEIPSDGEWRLMTSSKMVFYKSRREICIFYYNQKIGNVDFRGVPFIAGSR